MPSGKGHVPCDVMKTELLSYLMTKVEDCSHDVFFRLNRMGFMGYTPRGLGRIMNELKTNGLIEKVNRTNISVWKTKFNGDKS